MQEGTSNGDVKVEVPEPAGSSHEEKQIVTNEDKSIPLEEIKNVPNKKGTRGVKKSYVFEDDDAADFEEWTPKHKKGRKNDGYVKQETIGKENPVYQPKKKRIRRNDPNQCPACRQRFDDPNLLYFIGPPPDAAEEVVAMTDPSLSVFTGQEEHLNEGDERPLLKLTQFSIYDRHGHLCSLDGGAIEANQLLYACGFLKPVYSESGEAEGGVAVTEIGPINEWYIGGFDGGEKAIIGFSTSYSDYYLMIPSESYATLMNELEEK